MASPAWPKRLFILIRNTTGKNVEERRKEGRPGGRPDEMPIVSGLGLSRKPRLGPGPRPGQNGPDPAKFDFYLFFIVFVFFFIDVYQFLLILIDFHWFDFVFYWFSLFVA